MKRYIICLLIIPLFFSCTKEEKFVEPDFILQQWVNAIRENNYAIYRKYEAYPKSEPVFREIYRDFYFADLMVVNIDKLSQQKELKDNKGNTFYRRSVSFECAQVDRKTRKPNGLVRGDVDFIKFINGERKSEGWLMWNRNMIQTH